MPRAKQSKGQCAYCNAEMAKNAITKHLSMCPKHLSIIEQAEQKKGKVLQNKLSKVESQIKQLERDIQNDDKMLASNYDKHIEDAAFFMAYNKKKKDLDKLLEDWESVQLEIENT